ncbi:MAG: hypothetical protein AABZ47_17380 [Planctomycetota bacterium]
MTYVGTIRFFLAVFSFGITAPTFAQLVSVRCCTEESHLDRIADCVSGDGNLMQPETCLPGAMCVLGFGESTQLMAALCDLDATVSPIPERGYCSIWGFASLPAMQECVAKPNLVATLFSVFDDDGDGDLDEIDVAVFEKVRQPVPRTQQTEAVLTYVECCIPDAAIRGIGRCLSGPGVTTRPLDCEGTATCIAGFSEPVLPGDYLHGLCSSEPVIPPKPTEMYCFGWEADEVSTGFLCPSIIVPGNSLFSISDADDDADVDLQDFSAFQRALE